MGGVEGVDENKVLIDEILNNKKFVGGKYTKEQVVRDIRTKASLIVWNQNRLLGTQEQSLIGNFAIWNLAVSDFNVTGSWRL